MNGSADLAALKSRAGHMAGKLKLLSHPERLLMLCRLDESEASVGELVAMTGLSQSSVSQHLAMLRDDQGVSYRVDAQSRRYRLVDPEIGAIIHALWEICQASAAREAEQDVPG